MEWEQPILIVNRSQIKASVMAVIRTIWKYDRPSQINICIIIGQPPVNSSSQFKREGI